MESSGKVAVDPPRAPAPSTRAAAGNTPFFIVGCGRSGTTLLRLMMTGHSGIEIPPETWFILSLVRKFSLRDELMPSDVAEVVTLITDDYRWPDMGMAADSFLNRALALERPHLVDVINIIYDHHLGLSKKRRFGDKTPAYIEIVRELGDLYPGAKFIHLLRDGRDVAISFIHLGWIGGYRCYERDFEWTRALRFRDAYRQTDLDHRILDIKYEDLLREPEATVRAICDFLGEDFEPAMLDVSRRTDLVPARERKIHPKLDEPLSTEAIDRWRTTLSAVACFIMEACLQRNLRQWGYQLRFSSLRWRPILIAAGWVLLAVGPLLAKGIPYLQRHRYLSRTIYI